MISFRKHQWRGIQMVGNYYKSILETVRNLKLEWVRASHSKSWK